MSDLFFVIETFKIDDNRKLKAVLPDEDGWYRDVPVAALGKTTRNNTEYDIQSIIDGIIGPGSMMKMRIEEGTLIGEWGHPFADFSTKIGMNRLVTLEPTKESHSIRKITTKKVDDLNTTLVLADMKGTGPYGKYFVERMEDPAINLAFSLRSLARETRDRRTGVSKRKVISMVTFDAGVSSGGYKEASKRYVVANEAVKIEGREIVNYCIADDAMVQFASVAMESFTDSELNDMFKATEVKISKGTKIIFNADSETITDIASNKEMGVFHTLINRVRR